jgi:hypothetical protein
MATPLTLAQITAAYDKWHVRYQVYAGAGTRGRPGGITDAIGITEHHTGGGSASASYLYFLFITGRPDEGIPGPLCSEATDSGGTVHIGAVGRANHAGMGSSTTRDKVRSESYPGYSSEISPGPDNINGNPLYYGNEWIYSGTVPPTAAMYRGAALAAAARIDAHDWSALSAFAHREHTRRKDDPFGVNMAQFRRDVAAILKAGPAATVNYVATGKLEVPTTDTPTTQEGNDMGTWTEAQLRAMMQAEEEEYAVRFWIDPSGTGTAMRNLQTNMKLQQDRIEAKLDILLNPPALAANPLASGFADLAGSADTPAHLAPIEVGADGLTAQSHELLKAVEDSVNALGARPARAELQAFLNADGTMDDAPMEAPKSDGPSQGTA